MEDRTEIRAQLTALWAILIAAGVCTKEERDATIAQAEACITQARRDVLKQLHPIFRDAFKL